MSAHIFSLRLHVLLDWLLVVPRLSPAAAARSAAFLGADGKVTRIGSLYFRSAICWCSSHSSTSTSSSRKYSLSRQRREHPPSERREASLPSKPSVPQAFRAKLGVDVVAPQQLYTRILASHGAKAFAADVDIANVQVIVWNARRSVAATIAACVRPDVVHVGQVSFRWPLLEAFAAAFYGACVLS